MSEPAPVETAVVPDKRAQVEKLLSEILTLMEFPAALDFKDADDGSLSVAMHFAGELPAGVLAGKRSYLIDSLQFLVNKCINRPNTTKRWVSLGVGAFPEPRSAKPAGAAPPASPVSPVPPTNGARVAPAAKATLSAKAAQAPKAALAAKGEPSRAHKPARTAEPEEMTLDVPEDPALVTLGQSLAERSSALGRTYAVLMASTEDRSRLLKAGQDTPGVTVRVEGEGVHRRVSFIPAKPVPMPKKNPMHDFPDDED